jgi:hypothetical protein
VTADPERRECFGAGFGRPGDSLKQLYGRWRLPLHALLFRRASLTCTSIRPFALSALSLLRLCLFISPCLSSAVQAMLSGTIRKCSCTTSSEVSWVDLQRGGHASFPGADLALLGSRAALLQAYKPSLSYLRHSLSSPNCADLPSASRPSFELLESRRLE